MVAEGTLQHQHHLERYLITNISFQKAHTCISEEVWFGYSTQMQLTTTEWITSFTSASGY